MLFAPEFREILKLYPAAYNLRDVIREQQGKRKFFMTDDTSIFLNLNTPADLKAYLNEE